MEKLKDKFNQGEGDQTIDEFAPEYLDGLKSSSSSSKNKSVNTPEKNRNKKESFSEVKLSLDSFDTRKGKLRYNLKALKKCCNVHSSTLNLVRVNDDNNKTNHAFELENDKILEIEGLEVEEVAVYHYLHNIIKISGGKGKVYMSIKSIRMHYYIKKNEDDLETDCTSFSKPYIYVTGKVVTNEDTWLVAHMESTGLNRLLNLMMWDQIHDKELPFCDNMRDFLHDPLDYKPWNDLMIVSSKIIFIIY
jgi:hypothetical protein